jgi:hypothetical protein
MHRAQRLHMRELGDEASDGIEASTGIAAAAMICKCTIFSSGIHFNG